MFSDPIKATGRLHIELVGADGKLVEARDVSNLVVTAGLTHLAARAVGSPTAMSHMAAGTGATAAALGNTTLGTEIGRVALTSAVSSVNTIVYTATFGPGVATGSITELGVFNASSSGTMLARTVFAALVKDSLMTLTVTWTVTLN